MTDNQNIKDLIRSRGHWRVVIHPSGAADRVSQLSSLDRIIETNKVSLRGWDFPHVSHKVPIDRDLDSVGQDTQWEYHLDSWRLFRSGLFVAMCGLRYDWSERSGFWTSEPDMKHGSRLGVGDAIYTLTEVFEFASRLSTSDVGGEVMVISAKLVGANGRMLHVDSPKRGSLHRDYSSSVDEIPVGLTVERTRLIAEAWDLAASESRRLFEVFGWDAELGVINDFQDEMSAWSKSTQRRRQDNNPSTTDPSGTNHPPTGNPDADPP